MLPTKSQRKMYLLLQSNMSISNGNSQVPTAITRLLQELRRVSTGRKTKSVKTDVSLDIY